MKYAETVIGLEETLSEMFDRLAMPFEEQEELFAYARKKNIETDEIFVYTIVYRFA